MRRKPGYLAYFILIIFILAAGCKRSGIESQYSAYKPVLMSRTDLVNSIAISGSRPVDTVFKVGFLGNLLLVGETYQGIHLLDDTDPHNVRNVAFIRVPGVIDFVVKDSVIFVNNAVDLVAIRVLSTSQIQVIDREQDIFAELPPPDGRNVNPVFVRGKRPDNTEIVAWVRDENIDLHEDSMFIVTNLLATDDSHVFGLIGQSTAVYQSTDGQLDYKNLVKTNFDANYLIKYFDGHLMFVGSNSMRVFSISGDDLVFLNEYTGIGPSNYFALSQEQGDYLLAVSFHSDPNYWNLTNQLEIYRIGSFDRLQMDTIIKLDYPLGVSFRDSLMYVCDQGIKVFQHDSLFRQVFYEPGDAVSLYVRDSIMVSIGTRNLTQYLLRADSLVPVWQTPIEFAWLIK